MREINYIFLIQIQNLYQFIHINIIFPFLLVLENKYLQHFLFQLVNRLLMI